MRMPLTTAALALALFTLTGCLAPSSPAPTPLPSSTPVFESEEAALAAAEDAYREYLAVADQVFIDGGAHPERLEAVVTGDQLVAEIAGFRQVASDGYRSTGGTAFDHMELQRLSPDRSAEPTVVVYVCEDISAVDIRNASGQSVVSASRPNRVLYEISFDADSHAKLRVSLKEPWGSDC
jgi:hypothetical protein